MEYLLAIVVSVIVGFSIGWRSREQYAKYIVSEYLTQQDSDTDEDTRELVHITIETHNGVMYVYSTDKHEFMAQGATKEELEANLSARYPDTRFACEKEDMQKAGLA